MTVTAKTLVEMTQAPNVDTTVYTASLAGLVRTIIDKFTATNVTAGAVVITVNLVANAGVVGAGNIVTSVKSIAPNDSYTFPEIAGHVLNPGDFISIKAGAATSINVRVSGREVTA